MKRITLAIVLTLSSASVAFAQSPAPGLPSPLGNPSAVAAPPTQPPPPLPPRADGVPADMAFGAYQRGNFLYALLEAEHRLDANPKDAAAMTLIGEIYRDGAAVPRSDAEASRWYRLASNLGDRQAAYELGAMLVQGENGVTKDPVAAKAQFERAAAKDHPGALYNLGVMALQGLDGKAPDYKQAADYFLRAANAGDDDAAYSYGVMLRDGKGAPQNIAEASRWLRRAADDGIIAGQVEYAIMLFNGEGVKKDEAEAAKILLTAASRGNPIAQNRVAHLYVSGEALPKDMAKAAAWNSFAKAGGLKDDGLDVATANLTPDERSRFTKMVHELAGF
jgi:TPR repeat protein